MPKSKNRICSIFGSLSVVHCIAQVALVAVVQNVTDSKSKEGLGTKALGRRIREVPGGYELRERVGSYMADFSAQKGDIGLENTYHWNHFP